MSWKSETASARAQALKGFTPHLGDALLQAASQYDEVVVLPGPTGELNQLTAEPRGLFIARCDAGDMNVHRAYIAMALLTGNSVAICGHQSGSLCESLVTAGVPKAVVSACSYAEALSLPRLSGVSYVGDAVRELNRELAARDGVIVQLIYNEPLNAHLLSRFITERTVTINTAAIGGNAELLGMGEG